MFQKTVYVCAVSSLSKHYKSWRWCGYKHRNFEQNIDKNYPIFPVECIWLGWNLVCIYIYNNYWNVHAEFHLDGIIITPHLDKLIDKIINTLHISSSYSSMFSKNARVPLMRELQKFQTPSQCFSRIFLIKKFSSQTDTSMQQCLNI